MTKQIREGLYSQLKWSFPSDQDAAFDGSVFFSGDKCPQRGSSGIADAAKYGLVEHTNAAYIHQVRRRDAVAGSTSFCYNEVTRLEVFAELLQKPSESLEQELEKGWTYRPEIVLRQVIGFGGWIVRVWVPSDASFGNDRAKVGKLVDQPREELYTI